MQAKTIRSVIGVYAADEGESAKAYDALGAAHLGNVRLFRADETAEPSKRESRGRYAALRLEGECLIVAEAAPSKVPAIVHHLQSAGSPAVFVVSEALSDLAVPEVGPASAGNESIEDFARRCAERRGKPGTAKPRILSRLRENELILDASCRDLTEAANLEHALTAAAEWLLDNGYLIRTQIAEIRRHLPREHHRILPADTSGDPYIYELAKELVVHTDHSLNEANIRDCLRAYQGVAPLTIAELWSFPLLLRVALIAKLAQLALHVSRNQQLREAAYFWANRLAAGSRRGTEVFERVLHQMESEPVALEPYFVTCLAEQLQDEEDALAPVQHWIEERLKTPLTEMVRTEHTRKRRSASRQPTRSAACAPWRGSTLQRSSSPSAWWRRSCARTQPHLRSQRFCHSRPLPPRAWNESRDTAESANWTWLGGRWRWPSKAPIREPSMSLTICWTTVSGNWKRRPRRGYRSEHGSSAACGARDGCISGRDCGAHPMLYGAGAGSGLGRRRAPAGLAGGARSPGVVPVERTGHPDR